MKLFRVILIFAVWLSSILNLHAQENTLFSVDFFEHKAQNSAVVTANYANLAYRYTREVMHSQNDLRNKQNLDTALHFIDRALMGVDSTHFHAKDSLTRDSTKIGLLYIKRSRTRLNLAKKYLIQANNTPGYYSSQEYTQRAMNQAGNAISEAYTASIYFVDRNAVGGANSFANDPQNQNPQPNSQQSSTGNGDCSCCEEIKEMMKQLQSEGIPTNSALQPLGNSSNNNADSNNLETQAIDNGQQNNNSAASQPLETIPDLTPEEKSKEVRRLEADEATLTAIKDMYEKRIADKDAEIAQLEKNLANAKTDEERAEIQAKIDGIKSQQELLTNKRDGAEDKLRQVRNQLDELVKQEGYAKSGNGGQPIFSFDKAGYYNDENPIPIVQPIPDGLVYSIQLGVYHHHAIPDLFLGLYPLDGQSASGGMFRYRTGLFFNYGDAQEIKEKVRQLGLQDAFLIAYYNGELISIAKAIRIEEGN